MDLLIFAIGLAILIYIVFLIFSISSSKDKGVKLSPSSSAQLVLTVSLSVTVTFTCKEEIHIVKNHIFKTANQKISEQNEQKTILSCKLYDTDPLNNKYIIGDLKQNELTVLDCILEKERKNGGQKLFKAELYPFCKGDCRIENAYYRWRKCKEFYRSSSKVVYPSERYLYVN
jgi:hypothetical protein